MANVVFRLISRAIAVLVLLVFTVACPPRDFTLTVSGQDDAEGGEVFVNGKWVGSMKKSGGEAPQFVMTFPKGTLTIEVKKEGYLPFLEVITVTSPVNERLVDVKLVRDANLDDRQPNAAGDQPRPSSSPPNSKLPICPD